MDTQTVIDDPIQKAAEDRLAQLEAEDAAREQPATKPTEKGNAIDPADRRAGDDKQAKSAPDSKPKTGIPSEAEQKEIDTAKAEAEKEGKELEVDAQGVHKRDAQGKFVKRAKSVPAKIVLSPEEEKKFGDYYKQISTPYQHNETKQMLRWEKIKAAETELEGKTKSQSEALNKAIAKFNADVAAWKSEQGKAKGTPEQYDKFADKRANDVEVLKARIIQADNDGNIDESKKLYKELAIAERDAEQARKYAETLRKNPPPDDKQVQEQFRKDQQSWVDKAAIDYPDFNKKDSELRKNAVTYFQEMVKQHPAIARLPGFVYFAVEHTALKAAADRVPAMEKELDELRTKVKELEVLTNPTAPGSPVTQAAPKKFEDMSSDEQWESLQRQAAEIR